MGRVVHTVVGVVAGGVMILVVLLALVAARLSAGPVSLGFLAPTIGGALEGVTPWQLRIGDVGLLWRDWQRGLLLQLADLQATDGDGATVARIADLSVAFSPRALAHGVIAPVSVSARDGEFTIDAGEAGAAPAASDDGEGAIEGVLRGLRGPGDVARPLSFLLEADVADVTVRLHPPVGADWRVAIHRAGFARDATDRLTGDAALTLSQGEASADATIALAPSAADDGLAVSLGVSGLRPAAFAHAAPELAPLAAIDLPLQGRVDADVGPGGEVRQASADITGGDGALELTEAQAQAAGLKGAAQRLAVRSLALRAGWAAAGDAITVGTADIAFAPGTALFLPAPVDHRFPLARITAEGGLVGGKLSIPQATVDLDGLKAALQIDATDVPAAPSGTLVVTGRDVRVDDFRRYWPASAAPGAQEWCTERLRDGIVPEVTARLTFAPRNGGIEPTSLDARFDVQRLTVDYLPPMPPVRDASGSVTIDLRTMRIALAGGQAAGMTVRGGTIVFPDLERDPAFIDIDIAIVGPVQAAMVLISSPPLEYGAKIGVAPEQASGETEARLRMIFPLLDDLKEEQMEIEASVRLRDLGLRQVAPGVDVTNGQVQLDIDIDALRATGRLTVAGVPGDMEWTQAFGADADPQTRASFTAVGVPAERVRRGLEEIFDFGPYLIGGRFDGDVGVLIGADGRGRIDAALNVARAELAIPEIGWHKPSGVAGTIEAEIDTDASGFAGVPLASVLSAGLDARGSLRMRTDGRLERIDLGRLITGRTNLSGTLALLADGSWDLTIGGLGLDLGPMIAAAGKDGGASAKASPKLPDVTLAADLETLWLGDMEPIQRLQATVVHRDKTWPVVQLQGALADGSRLEMAIAPEADRARSLTLTAGNAGAALRAFNLYSDMIGGRLEASGRFDDADPASPLAGRLHVEDFHVVNTPVLARLLNVLALTGIRDTLTGRGIAFSRLDIPFRLRDGLLNIDGGRAFGAALGLTASGSVDTRAEMIDLRGRLVPFYAINSALGRLPLVGNIMTGGVKGGGVFSASYSVSGPLAEPDVSVNPASVLFPGFLRWILETFQGWVRAPLPPLGENGASP